MGRSARKARRRHVDLPKRRSISWCYTHDSHVSGDPGRCEAAEGQLPPWEWDETAAECVVGRALLELPEVPK